MDKNKMHMHCLVAALTLLVKGNVIEESKITDAIESKELRGLYDALNERYKEIVNEELDEKYRERFNEIIGDEF